MQSDCLRFFVKRPRGERELNCLDPGTCVYLHLPASRTEVLALEGAGGRGSL